MNKLLSTLVFVAFATILTYGQDVTTPDDEQTARNREWIRQREAEVDTLNLEPYIGICCKDLDATKLAKKVKAFGQVCTELFPNYPLPFFYARLGKTLYMILYAVNYLNGEANFGDIRPIHLDGFCVKGLRKGDSVDVTKYEFIIGNDKVDCYKIPESEWSFLVKDNKVTGFMRDPTKSSLLVDDVMLENM